MKPFYFLPLTGLYYAGTRPPTRQKHLSSGTFFDLDLMLCPIHHFLLLTLIQGHGLYQMPSPFLLFPVIAHLELGQDRVSLHTSP